MRRLMAGMAVWAGMAGASAAALAGQDGSEGGAGSSGGGTARILSAARVLEAPRIDGRLDDPAWASAAVAGGFVQFRPDPGEPASERTEVRVLYTDDAVYVGARMLDRDPEGIIRRLARRDEEVTTDAFQVAFDSYLDRRTAFHFAVSVAGVQSDRLLFSDTDEDSDWDAVWESAARTDAEGWTAELRIPFSQLRFASASGGGGPHSWGVNFWRLIARHGEVSAWSPLPDDGSRVVSAFGTLRDLEGIRPGRRIEGRPYVLSSATRAPGLADNPFHAPTALRQTVGGDFKFGVTDNLTLDVTVNPDFGQVEADPSVVNLTAFETFFPEKRPFFQEGADIFEFSLGPGGDQEEALFYSRRIGRQPQGSIASATEHENVPDATTIVGAAKLSGKTSSGWSLGLLNAVTGNERAHFTRPGGEHGAQLVEPITNYAVGRVIRDFRDGESAVGFFGTAVNRQVRPEGPLAFLPEGSYAGGLDFRHRFGGGDYEVTGHVLGSHVVGGAAAIDRLQRSPVRYYQRPDADHLGYDPGRTSLTGAVASATVARVGGSWNYGLFGETRSPGFAINELGFQSGADYHVGAAFVGYQRYRPQGPFRSWGWDLATWTGWNYGGERQFGGGNLNGNFQLTNFWRGFVNVNHEGPGFQTAALRGGPALYSAAQTSVFGGMFTDSRKAVQLGLVGNYGAEWGARTRRAGISPNVTLQPSSRFQLTLSPSIQANLDQSQYVTQRRSSAGQHYVHGRIRQQTVSLTTRLNYTFSPDLSLQLYAQPFVSAARYDHFSEVDDPRASAFDDRFRSYDPRQVRSNDVGAFGVYQVDADGDGAADFAFGDPDFNVRSFRSNLVLRWQYRPGSTLFVVWSRDQQAFASDGTFDFGRDFGEIAGMPSTNVFLMKFEYWLGL